MGRPEWEVTKKGNVKVGNKVLTIVYEEAQQIIDSAIAAVVNEIHNLGHTVKEVRVMGDTGETKVALNTVAGVNPEVAGEPAPPVQTAPPIAAPVETPVTAPTEPPAVDATGTGAPVDTPTTPLTAKQQKEQDLLDQLAALRQEPDEDVPAGDPTNSGAAEPPAAPAS